MRTDTNTMSVEEYIQYELKSERRHEYVDGNLFVMPGEKKLNNRIAFALAMLLHQQLFPGYIIYNHDVKVAIPGGNKYFYPDIVASNEPDTDAGDYVLQSPVLIVEVVSDSNHKHDYVDKYIDYTQIASLEYYLIVEPETVFITVHQRDGEGWIAHQYTRLEAHIDLPGLGISLPVADIYKGISFATYL